ncbi:mitochondrial ribosomal protein subunit L20-domain-containing protein [Myxozyma melibiosi]|uniref:Mitochondrial ribosomal protein subunit L20-domain-containing protein n=1 Tax=Myxozyma melibiosi TaxID=54550 RepID=A0ABR1FF91_9ASCO
MLPQATSCGRRLVCSSVLSSSSSSLSSSRAALSTSLLSRPASTRCGLSASSSPSPSASPFSSPSSSRPFSSSATVQADPNPNKVTKLKDPAKFNTPFPTRHNPRSSANKAAPVLPPGLTYNPPPSAPSPFDTPDIFLPPHERAKVLTAPGVEVLPPPLRAVEEKKYHLDEEQIEKIRQLREQDPNKYTRKVLAKEFGCSDFFIALVLRSPQERLDEMDRRLGIIKSRWNLYKSTARLMREKRREQWARDE